MRDSYSGDVFRDWSDRTEQYVYQMGAMSKEICDWLSNKKISSWRGGEAEGLFRTEHSVNTDLIDDLVVLLGESEDQETSAFTAKMIDAFGNELDQIRSVTFSHRCRQ